METEVSDENWQEDYPFQVEKTLRDEFAMTALTGELAAQSCGEFYKVNAQHGNFRQLSTRCYQIADAMMKARENV